MDALLDDILRPDYLTDPAALDLAELRARRAICQGIETQLSFLRRLAQGHLDIARAELERRRDGGDPADVAALVDRLPEILSDRTSSPGPGHLPPLMHPGDVEGRLARRLDELLATHRLDEPQQLDIAELDVAVADLGAFEREVSGLRRQLFDRIDTVQHELARRYQTGEASIEAP